jgi:nucleotide-binding universal stress UspA family protein
VGQKLLTGDAWHEIVKLAEEGQFDLIVMGTHGRTGIKHALMGSVAEKVLRKATCPVLTVRAAEGKG